MFEFTNSKHPRPKPDHSRHYSSKFEGLPFHIIPSLRSKSRTSASLKPVASGSILARSTTQPDNKTDAGAIAGGVVGSLILFAIFVSLLIHCIRRKGPASQPRQHRKDTDSSTKDLISEPAPLDTEVGENTPKAAPNHSSSPGKNNSIVSPLFQIALESWETMDHLIIHVHVEAPLSDTPAPHYTAFELSPPPSPKITNRSTQTDAVAQNAATPCNSPLGTYPFQRRGIGFTESGQSVSPRLTVAKISARLEEAEQAQNEIIED